MLFKVAGNLLICATLYRLYTQFWHHWRSFWHHYILVLKTFHPFKVAFSQQIRFLKPNHQTFPPLFSQNTDLSLDNLSMFATLWREEEGLGVGEQGLV